MWGNLKLWFLLSAVPTVLVVDLLWLAVRRKPRPPYVQALGHAYWRLARSLHIVNGAVRITSR